VSRRLLIVALLAIAAPAHADDPPWSKGVSAEHKDAAKRLLEAGNELFLANKYKEALVKYEAAVAEWDHPAIRFNMVRAQIALDKIVDASDNLEKALAFGAKPLEEVVYQEALNYQKLLAHQIASLELTCNQHGVTVKLDGDTVLSCPGTTVLRRAPGKHVVIGVAAGKATYARDLTLIGGERETIGVSLSAPELRAGPRWARWKPWVVVAGGAATAVVGLGFRVVAQSKADEIDLITARQCPTGCSKGDFAALGLAAIEARMTTQSRIAVTGLAIGMGTILVGGALVILNRRLYERATVTADANGASIGIAGRF